MINQSTVAVTAFLAVVLMLVPRKYFLVPFILAACFVPRDQRILIMGLDFNVLRILIVFGFIRMVIRGEHRSVNWRVFDKVLFLWAGCGALIYIVQWGEMRAVIYKSGVLFDVIGMYWLFRQNVAGFDDIERLVRVFAICACVMVPLVAIEWVTGQNPFAVFGKVTTELRQGRLRCQGPFPISILMGVFWATLVPMFAGMLAKARTDRFLYYAAIACCLFIIVASASATPLVVLIFVFVAMAGFKFRFFARRAVLAMAIALGFLHVIMKAPIWHLISRVKLVGGATGWHRYYLIDQAVKHFNEWAMFGTRDTSHWDYKQLKEITQFDVTNQYIFEGINGGFITLIIFLVMLVIAYHVLAVHFQRGGNTKYQWFTWCVFVGMLSHYLAFFGVAYFGQIMMLWYLMLAVVGFLAEQLPRTAALPVPRPLPTEAANIGIPYRRQ